MLSKIVSFGLLGIEAYPIEIEVDVSEGLPIVSLVGLANTSIKESKERVKSALKNSGFDWPIDRITISMVPSDIKKEGTCYDLAIAIGILAATDQLNSKSLKDYYIMGELSLDGSLRPTQGVLPISLKVSESSIKNIIIPLQNAKEAAIVSDVNVFPVKTLRETVEFLNDQTTISPYKLELGKLFKQNSSYQIDFSDCKGQYLAKRAIEVAVAGGHNLLMIGPPGSGKTMLAKRLPTIMPDLGLKEALEITKIHSVASINPINEGLICTRPFRNPHHTTSNIALVGGGPNPKPGEISLAHYGVLFLDELPEFRRDCLEAMRQPLEDGYVSVSRINRSIVFPSSFILVCAMNPCPCGYYTDTQRTCSCNPNKIKNYLHKISGPLLDRIDIHISLPSIKYKDLTDTRESECSSEIKKRVEKARSIQNQRFKENEILFNAKMNSKMTKKYCMLDSEAKNLLRMAMTELGMSARAYDKILKVSRTIADLGGSEMILAEHVSEAIQYRSLDKNF